MYVRGTLEIGATILLSHPTSPLVVTHHRRECLVRCDGAIAKAHHNVNYKGRVLLNRANTINMEGN
jgi:hypothetical protein